MDGRLERSFAAVVCDWDGTLVADRHVDASGVRRVLARLSRLGTEVVITSGTNVATVVDQLRPRVPGPGSLHVCANRGSEVYRVEPDGVRLLHRRQASPAEDAALDRAAAHLVAVLERRGLGVRLVGERLNRRKIDLIPEPTWAEPPKARIAELLAATSARLLDHGVADLGVVLDLARAAATAAGLDARITTDAKHVEIGLTDKGDAMAWALDHLSDSGIGPGLVLVGGDELGELGGWPGSDARLLAGPGTGRVVAVSVGVEPGPVPAAVTVLGGGPARFLGLLTALADRLEHDLPDLDDDPSWLLSLPVDPARDGADAALTTVADGTVGTRGEREESTSSEQSVRACVYTGSGTQQRLLVAPSWFAVRGFGDEPATADERTLDLRSGLLLRRRTTVSGEERSVRFAAAGRPGLGALRARVPARRAAGPPLSGAGDESGSDGAARWARVAADPLGGVAVAAEQHAHGGNGWTLDRQAFFVVDPQHVPAAADAVTALRTTARMPLSALVAEQRAVWAARWRTCDITIDGDEELQRDVRLALHHLNASVRDGGECAVGARGLTGAAYAGHVFWDADVFVLPVMAATRPGAARAMLEYRRRRLRAARATAEAQGLRGARFPWESARVGTDVTPREGWLGAVEVPIHTGEAEEHIVSDVAWAAWQYARWTGDEAYLLGPGRALLVDAARYWASRTRTDEAGRAHIDHVIGPDEYHQLVDDDVFTNVMARWTLRRAAELTAKDPNAGDDPDAAAWLALADALVDGYDARTGVYEQFRGYHRLAPVPRGALDATPVAADLLLGPEEVARTQIIKQADVLMAHHLVPGEMAAGSLVPNLAHYGPRTAHGSSLSPAIHASLLARAGRPDEAVPWLTHAVRIDLDDVTGTTTGGLHLAAAAGVWHALAFGFLGLEIVGGALRIDPRLPSGWRALTVCLRLRGTPVRITADRACTQVRADAPVWVADPTGSPVRVTEATWPVRDQGPSSVPAEDGSLHGRERRRELIGHGRA